MKAAARAGCATQPTLSRHITALEGALGVELFDRTGRGLSLSPSGALLLERAIEVESSVFGLERQAHGLATRRVGSARVSMTQLFGAYFAPPWVHDLRAAHPSIQLELVLDDDVSDLLARQADIALRLFRPVQLDLVVASVGVHHYGFFASSAYLKERGPPQGLDDLRSHELIGFDRSTRWLDQARSAGFVFAREDFACRSDDDIAQVELARAGLGIAALPTWIGALLGLERVLPSAPMPSIELYLTARREVRSNPVVARVWAHLMRVLREKFA